MVRLINDRFGEPGEKRILSVLLPVLHRVLERHYSPGDRLFFYFIYSLLSKGGAVEGEVGRMTFSKYYSLFFF